MTRGLTTRPEYAGLRAMGIEIVEVYGCAAYVESDGTRREWMIMEEIADAEAIENKWLAMARPRGGASRRAGFSVASYPELADFVKKTRPYRYGEHVTVISFSDLAQAIEDTLGISKYAGHFKDLNGNNVLVQTRPDGTRRYMLIDIGSSL